MKIAYVIPSLIQAGNVCVVKDLATVMCMHGHDCVVYYFDDKLPGYEFPCPTRRIQYWERIPFDDYDIVHTHALRADMYTFLFMPKSKAKMVCTIHNYVFEDAIAFKGKILGPVLGLINQLCRLRNDRFLVLSQAHFNYYKKWFGTKKLRIVYNTRVLDKSKDISEEDKKFFDSLRKKYKTICASVCQVTERKGLDQIVKALSRIDDNYCFVIIGSGVGLPKLKQLAKDEGVSDRVFFLGGRSDGYTFMPNIDIFCIPSHSEGFPLAMIEAASYGKAIVSSDLPVFKEVFSKEECVICKEYNIESIAEGIKRAARDKDILGKNAKARFEKDYSPEVFYYKHVNIYNELLGL